MGGLDPRGCLLAFAAAIGAATTFILSRRLVTEQDMFVFSMHLHWICAVAVALALIPLGLPQVPVTGWGWLGLTGVGVFYVSAMLLQFASIRLAGPAPASIVFNAEPIITMVGAALLLGERLGPWQLVGAALVIAGVMLSTRADPSAGE